MRPEHTPKIDRSLVEAGRILMETHQDWLIPKVEFLDDKVVELASEYQLAESPVKPELFLHIIPTESDCWIALPRKNKPQEQGQATNEDAFDLAAQSIRLAWHNNAPFSGFFIPDPEIKNPYAMVLFMRIGGWENNQPLRGLISICWTRSERGLPFKLPELQEQLLPATGGKILPLPPHFERTRQLGETWIGLPAKIKRSAEWAELETAVTIVSQTGQEIVKRLVPVIADAAWRSMAERVMHELSRTVAMPQPMLKESSKALGAALATLRRAKLPIETGLEDKLSAHLKTIQNNLHALEADQNYVESKVRWFFYLVAEELRAEAAESASIQKVIGQVIESLGGRMPGDAQLQAEDHPNWKARLKLPRMFPQHCLEALISNSFLHRLSGAAIRFTWAETEAGDGYLEWTNPTSADNAKQLEEELKKPPTSRSFGLRMTDAISTTFFQQSLDILIEYEKEQPIIRHRLKVASGILEHPEVLEKGSA